MNDCDTLSKPTLECLLLLTAVSTVDATCDTFVSLTALLLLLSTRSITSPARDVSAACTLACARVTT